MSLKNIFLSVQVVCDVTFSAERRVKQKNDKRKENSLNLTTVAIKNEKGAVCTRKWKPGTPHSNLSWSHCAG